MIDSFCLWAPGLAAKTDWQDWIRGKKNIDDSTESPKITFASPIVTRRFSQLTKMTCYMAHRLKLDTDMLFFTSARGEIDIQYKINTSFARENEVKPAEKRRSQNGLHIDYFGQPDSSDCIFQFDCRKFHNDSGCHDFSISGYRQRF